ncbi:hypothetical protein ACU686_02840 [Yinghuangia aomiensis]
MIERPDRNRGAGPAGATTTSGGDVSSDTGGFDFAGMCADVHSAAAGYEPLGRHAGAGADRVHA